jgi:hypothetical protein
MKHLAIKENTAHYLSRFPKKAHASADYEKFIRTCFSVLPPPKVTLAERLKKSPKLRFKLS